MDGDSAVDGQRVVVHEPRVSTQLVDVGNLVHSARDKTHETITLALHASHHGLAVDVNAALELETESGETFDRVRRLGRRDQQLAGHAADTGAGRAIGPAFDEQRARTGRLGGAIRRQSGRAGADHRHVHAQFATEFATEFATQFASVLTAASGFVIA